MKVKVLIGKETPPLYNAKNEDYPKYYENQINVELEKLEKQGNKIKFIEFSHEQGMAYLLIFYEKQLQERE